MTNTSATAAVPPPTRRRDVRMLPWLLVIATPTFAEEIKPAEIPLWPDGAPKAVGNESSDQPGIRIHRPKKPNGCGVVVCPGGGYGVLAYDHEGHQVGKWFAKFGVTAAVLKYRHAPKYRHPIPLGDVQRAIRHMRANAKPLGLDPDRIGVMGFSAGGHLASTAATHFDEGDPKAEDEVDRVSSRPDFAILAYPVITMAENFTHRGSVRNLLGEKPSAELLENLSNEKQVTKETPPTFLFHTADDPAVPVKNAIEFFAACQKHGVPSELHIYQHGPHGVGLAPGDPVLRSWPERLKDWLRQGGFLTNRETAAVQGSIRLDGAPLRWGQIALVPNDETLPTSMAMIARGKFSLSGRYAAPIGEHSVEIFNLGAVVPQPTIDDAVQLDRGRLRVEVREGQNTFDFDLRTEE